MAASIGCSLSGVGLLLQNHYPRFRGAPFVSSEGLSHAPVRWISGNAPAATDTLQMVRAEVNVRDFQPWMGTRRLQDPDHAMHCLLTECFGDLAPKPFRLMVTRRAATRSLYGYGYTDATALREAAADPLQASILPAAGMDSKPVPSGWQPGRRLGFEVRIRPIVRRTDKVQDRPGKECDAFLHEALQHSQRGDMTRTREQVRAEGLSDRLEGKGGVSLDLPSVKLVSFQRTRAYRKLWARHTEGLDAVRRGIVTIADPDAYAGTFSQGVGRHRSYGYGMVLLRPARQ